MWIINTIGKALFIVFIDYFFQIKKWFQGTRFYVQDLAQHAKTVFSDTEKDFFRICTRQIWQEVDHFYMHGSSQNGTRIANYH